MNGGKADGGACPSLADDARRAADFRGDVTVVLRDGRCVQGFAFDARLDGPRPSLRMLPTDSSERVELELASIASIACTGKDAASGKSWENWVRR
ncbi:MAG: hypothetical protein ACO3QC_14590, partial [Phycisphaerales bacterium]